MIFKLCKKLCLGIPADINLLTILSDFGLKIVFSSYAFKKKINGVGIVFTNSYFRIILFCNIPHISLAFFTWKMWKKRCSNSLKFRTL